MAQTSYADEACEEPTTEELGTVAGAKLSARFCGSSECPARALHVGTAANVPSMYETSKGLAGSRVLSVKLVGETLTVVTETCDRFAEPSTSTETLTYDSKAKRFARKSLTTVNPYRERQKQVLELATLGKLCEARKELSDIGTMPNGTDDITAEYVGAFLKAVVAKNDVKAAKEFLLHPGGEEPCPKTLAAETTCVGGFEPCRDLNDFVYDTQNQADWVAPEHIDLLLDLVTQIQKAGENQLAVALYRDLQRTREARAWLGYADALAATGEPLVAESAYAQYEKIEKKAPTVLEAARKRPKQAEYARLEDVPASLLTIDRDSLFNAEEIVFRVTEPTRIAGRPCHPGRAIARREDGQGPWTITFCPGKR